MILEMHLCGPKGDGQRQELDAACRLLQLDNEFLIQAMLGAGRAVPDLVDDLGLRYKPPTRQEASTPRERFYGLYEMLRVGAFSCQDAAAWEAAVLTIKYGLPSRCFVQDAGGDGLWHAVYRTPTAVIDPVARFLAKNGRSDYRWEAVQR